MKRLNYGRKVVRDQDGQVIRVGIVSLPNEEDLKQARKQLRGLAPLIAKLNASTTGVIPI